MEKTLKVWLEKQGYSVDKDISFDVNPHVKATIKKLDKPYETIELGLERVIALEEYQGGFIGKFCRELKDLLAHFLQEYGIKHGLEFAIDPKEIHSNEEELYKVFRSYCDKHKLRNLEKPSSGSVLFVFKELEAQKLLDLSDKQPSDAIIISAIDWYNAGKLQRHSTNTFLHFFIPLELLSQKSVSETSWKKENEEKHKLIISFLRSELKGEEFRHKLQSLESSLPRFAFMEQIERYFSSLFSKEEIDGFWEDDSDITFNGKHAWKQYRLMSQQKRGGKRANLFSVLKRLYNIRNDIVHKGLREVASEDIFIVENILRRVLKKEL